MPSADIIVPESDVTRSWLGLGWAGLAWLGSSSSRSLLSHYAALLAGLAWLALFCGGALGSLDSGGLTWYGSAESHR